jgi:hypothetical protein
MARAAVPITALSTTGTDVKVGTGTALDATNHHVITLTCPLEELVIRVENTTASTKAVTIKAGDNPPAESAGQGDLSVSLTAGNSTAQLAQVAGLESARFVQNDGTLLVDVASGMTGFIAAYRVPRV